MSTRGMQGLHRRRRQRLVAGLFTIALVVLLGFAVASVTIVPEWLHPPLTAQERQTLDVRSRLAAEDSRRKLQNEVRTSLLQGVGALLLLTSAGIGAWLTARQLRLNQEGQITERFTRAVDQLGSEHIDVRLGAIYALERIARDSESDSDRAVIGEILSSYVRPRAPWPPNDDNQPGADTPIGNLPWLGQRAPDVQAVLTVVGRVDFSEEHTLRGRPVAAMDLLGVDLRGIRLISAYLREIDLRDAHLEAASLANAHLARIDLRRATLVEADLRGASLVGVDLREANLERAELIGVSFLYDSTYPSLLMTDLSDAWLVGANLRGAHFGGSLLKRANLQGADLTGARGGCDLRGADLRDAKGLDQADLTGAIADSDTAWPEGFDWKAAGVKPPILGEDMVLLAELGARLGSPELPHEDAGSATKDHGSKRPLQRGSG